MERCRFAKTLDVTIEKDVLEYSITLSLFGARNSNNPAKTLTIRELDNNAVLLRNMEEYTSFRITGVALKFLPTGVTAFDVRPTCMTIAYSDTEIIHPDIVDERLHALPTYQIMALDPCKPVKRYYTTATAMKRAGVLWCPCKEYTDDLFNGVGPTYDAQLTVDKSASVHVKIKRALIGDFEKPFAEMGKLQVIYYVTFKG